MGVKNDIRWLREIDERTDLFILIAKKGPIKVREIKKFLGADDWWPTKNRIKSLFERELVEEVEEGYLPTEQGEKVFESLKTVNGIESI